MRIEAKKYGFLSNNRTLKNELKNNKILDCELKTYYCRNGMERDGVAMCGNTNMELKELKKNKR